MSWLGHGQEAPWCLGLGGPPASGLPTWPLSWVPWEIELSSWRWRSRPGPMEEAPHLDLWGHKFES